MDIADADERFEAFLEDRGIELERIDADALLDAVLAFYVDVRADDARPVEDFGDRLLFQWGTYDWGDGPSFQYDLTRQLIAADEIDDDAIWQLSTTLHDEPDSNTAALGSGEQWSDDLPQIDAFRAFVASHPATALARARRPDRVEIDHDLAG